MADLTILDTIKTHFEERTGDGGDMAIPPRGIRWTILSPYPKIQEALQRAIKQKGGHLGVLMPYEDVVLKPGQRGPYDDDQPVAGSLRELHFYITVFIRSIKAQVTDGAFLLLSDWLEELTRSYAVDGNDTLRVHNIRYMGLDPDYLIVEATGSIKYFTDTSRVQWPKLLGVITEGPDADGDGSNDFWFDVDLS